MSSILQKQFAMGSAVALPVAIEVAVAYSGRVAATYQTVRAIIKCWATVTYGTLATSISTKIRRGNGITGAVVASGTPENVAASTTSEVNLQFTEQLLNAEYTDYTFTITVASTGTACTANLGTIDVELING